MSAKVVCAVVIGLELSSMVVLRREYFILNSNSKPLIRYFAVAWLGKLTSLFLTLSTFKGYLLKKIHLVRSYIKIRSCSCTYNIIDKTKHVFITNQWFLKIWIKVSIQCNFRWVVQRVFRAFMCTFALTSMDTMVINDVFTCSSCISMTLTFMVQLILRAWCSHAYIYSLTRWFWSWHI